MKDSFVFLVAATLIAAPTAFAAESSQLKYVVIVSRHGVRSPTWDAARLNQYSAEPWPDWGVPPGNLTPHGRQLMTLMGANYRSWLSKQRLLDPVDCRDASRIFIYADKDQRTVETARALAESIAPGCGVETHSQSAAGADPVFSGTFTPDPDLARKAIEQRLDPDLVAHHRAAIEALRNILGPGAKPPVGDAEAESKGPFSTASTLTENLLLEYTNGLNGKELGWGRLTKENLFQVLELHTIYADLTRRTPYLARRGSNLLDHIQKSLEQAATGRPVDGSLGNPGDKVLVISGHDTNLSNLSGLLGITWKMPGYQPDDAPPGGALLFTLWQDASGQMSVQLRFAVQTLEQMHNLEPGPPVTQDVAIPGCNPCTWKAFQETVRKMSRQRF